MNTQTPQPVHYGMALEPGSYVLSFGPKPAPAPQPVEKK